MWRPAPAQYGVTLACRWPGSVSFLRLISGEAERNNATYSAQICRTSSSPPSIILSHQTLALIRLKLKLSQGSDGRPRDGMMPSSLVVSLAWVPAPPGYWRPGAHLFYGSLEKSKIAKRIKEILHEKVKKRTSLKSLRLRDLLTFPGLTGPYWALALLSLT